MVTATEVLLAGLTDAQAARRRDLEDRIADAHDRGLAASAAMGEAFEAIRDEGLYLDYDPPTFRRYCADRWGISETQVYLLVDIACVLSAAAERGLPPPPSQAVVRELMPVLHRRRGDAAPLTDQQATTLAEVWRETLAAHDDGATPTAATTRAYVVKAGYRPELIGQSRPDNARITLGAFGDQLPGLHKRLAKLADRLGTPTDQMREMAARYVADLRGLADRLEDMIG